MLADERHIKLGGLSYVVDEQLGGPTSLIRPAYNNSYPSELADRVDISGDPSAQNLEPWISRWSYDSFVGGEGNTFFDPNAPNTYDNATKNPRNPGKLTGMNPALSSTIIAGTHPAQQFLVISGGVLWWAGGNLTRYSSDAVNWTNQANGLPGGTTITGACGDGTALYIHYTDNPGGASGAAAGIRQVKVGSNAAVVTAGGAVQDTLGKGLACIPPFIYRFTGNRLFQYDISNPGAWPIAGTLVHTTGPDPFTQGDIIATDNSICYYSAQTGGNPQVYQFTAAGSPLSFSTGAGAPIWGGTDLAGFNAKTMTFAQGKLYLAGVYNAKAALFQNDLVNRQASFIGFIRQSSSLTPVAAAVGYGAQVLVLTTAGSVFVYDAEQQAISQLSYNDPNALVAFAQGKAVATYLDQRVIVGNSQVGAGDTAAYAIDRDDVTATTGQTDLWVSSAWDFGLPFERRKTLLGFRFLTSTLSATSQITNVEYMLDESGVFVVVPGGPWSADPVTGSHTSIYIPVSDALAAQGGTGTLGSIQFTTLRYEVATGGSGVSPTIYRATAEVYNANHAHTLEVVVKLDETPQNEGIELTQFGWQQVQHLKTLNDARLLFTVVDGYEDSALNPDNWVTYTLCGMEDLEILLNRGTGNRARFTLRMLDAP